MKDAKLIREAAKRLTATIKGLAGIPGLARMYTVHMYSLHVTTVSSIHISGMFILLK